MRTRTKPEPLTYRQLLARLSALPDEVLDEPVSVLDPRSEDVEPVAEALDSCDVPDELEAEGVSFVLVVGSGLRTCYSCKLELSSRDELEHHPNSRGGQDRVCSGCKRDILEFEAEQVEHQ